MLFRSVGVAASARRPSPADRVQGRFLVACGGKRARGVGDVRQQPPCARADVVAGGDAREIVVERGDHFEWLADPSGIGCLDPRAGSAPRSPRASRLRIAGLPDELDPTTARTALRALGRGFPALIQSRGTGLAELLRALRADPLRVPEDDLRRLGVVLCFDGTRLVAAHLMRVADLATRRAPALLAVWDSARAAWDDFAWAAVPEFAERCGIPQVDYEARHAERMRILQ